MSARKRVLLPAVVLSLVIMLGMCVSVSAASEISLPLDNAWTDTDDMTMDHTLQYYRVDLPGDGQLTVTLQSWMNYVEFKLFDEDLTQTFFDTEVSKGSENEPATGSESIYLKEGTYYIQVYQFTGYTGTSYTNTGKYRLKADFIDGNTNETEPNDTPEAAMELFPGETQVSLMWANDQYDYYKLTLSEPQKVKFSVKSWMNYIQMGVRNSDFMEAADVVGTPIEDVEISKGTLEAPVSQIYEFDLGGGTWYIFFRKFEGYVGYSYSNTGIYSLTWVSDVPADADSRTSGNGITIESLDESEEPEPPSESWMNKDSITADHTLQYYKLSLPGDGQLTATVQSWMNYVNYKLWDEDLTKTYYDEEVSKGSENEPATHAKSIYLKAGTYYLEVYQFTGYTGTSYTNTGDYRVKIEFEDGHTNETEPNDTPEKAAELVPGEVQVSLMWADDQYDYYKLTLNEPQTVRLMVKSWFNYIEMGIRNADFMEAADVSGTPVEDVEISKGTLEAPVSQIYEFNLGGGTWYIFFRKFEGYTGASYSNTGIYSLSWER